MEIWVWRRKASGWWNGREWDEFGRRVLGVEMRGWVWMGNRGRWTAGRGNVGGDFLARAEVGIEPREEDKLWESALGKVGHSPKRGQLGKNGK